MAWACRRVTNRMAWRMGRAVLRWVLEGGAMLGGRHMEGKPLESRADGWSGGGWKGGQRQQTRMGGAQRMGRQPEESDGDGASRRRAANGRVRQMEDCVGFGMGVGKSLEIFCSYSKFWGLRRKE